MEHINDTVMASVLTNQSIKKVREIALKDGYVSSQIDVALKYIVKSRLTVEIKENDLFDIKNESNNEYIDIDIDLNTVVERGHDCLRNMLEHNLREDEVSLSISNKLLEHLNGMFENIQYTIKENEEGKYLALNI